MCELVFDVTLLNCMLGIVCIHEAHICTDLVGHKGGYSL